MCDFSVWFWVGFFGGGFFFGGGGGVLFVVVGFGLVFFVFFF